MAYAQQAPFAEIDKGHKYRLSQIGGVSNEEVILTFVKKEKNPETGELETVYPGTTNEAVICVLIDRIEQLDKKMESEFNKNALKSLKEALVYLHARTMDRIERDVEGTTQE